jgi:nanoRNase/pAp phosphatase (c-di-AMP/oligoRNAs hydrolase)
VANALLYGTKTDTNSLCRDTHDVDLQAFNHLSPKTNPRVVGWIEHPHLPLAYFADYHRGLSQATLYKDVAVSYLGRIDSEAIIPELADLLLRIEGVHWSLCFGTVRESMILSVRSTSKKQMAGTVIRRLCGSIGFCGGHRRLAGGLIPLSRKDEAGVQDFAQKIIDRFLGLIGVQECRPRPLVQAGIDSP